LGFIISGGPEKQHICEDQAIILTKIITGGAVAIVERMKINDVILKVNDVSVVNVTYSAAVEALKRAGNIVRLVSNLETLHFRLFFSNLSLFGCLQSVRRRTQPRSPSRVEIV